MVTKAKALQDISVLPLDRREFELTLIGASPLIVHAWSPKAKQEMLDKQMKKASSGREVRDPKKDFLDSLYWMSDRPLDQDEAYALAISGKAKFGFPSTAFKQVAISQAHKDKGLPKTAAMAAFHVNLGEELVEIKGTPRPREDMVRIGMGSADIRFRAEFPSWEVTLRISHNFNALSAEQVVNLYRTAGFACGIGEWRAEKSGQFGMFDIKLG